MKRTPFSTDSRGSQDPASPPDNATQGTAPSIFARLKGLFSPTPSPLPSPPPESVPDREGVPEDASASGPDPAPEPNQSAAPPPNAAGPSDAAGSASTAKAPPLTPLERLQLPPSWVPPDRRALTRGAAKRRLFGPARAESAPPPCPVPSKESPYPVAIALQGGGAHGAFSWGVLDRLLDEDGLKIVSMSGTSAGAMNATICAYGLLHSGRETAKDLLSTYWQKVARAGSLSPLRTSWWDKIEGSWSLDNSPWLALMDVAVQFVSPYQSNPLGLNPLQEILEDLVDFSVLRNQDEIGLYIAATNVHSGRPKVFTHQDLDAPHVMASACLPFMFQAVEIDGVPYWDGGYLCNPPLIPLVSHGGARDLLVVPINPCYRETTPRTARDIFNRLNEITFNSSLERDLETISLINHLIDQGQLEEQSCRRLYLHFLDDDSSMRQLSASSKINTEWDFLQYLRDLGWNAADQWVAHHWDALGTRNSALAPLSDQEESGAA